MERLVYSLQRSLTPTLQNPRNRWSPNHSSTAPVSGAQIPGASQAHHVYQQLGLLVHSLAYITSLGRWWVDDLSCVGAVAVNQWQTIECPYGSYLWDNNNHECNHDLQLVKFELKLCYSWMFTAVLLHQMRIVIIWLPTCVLACWARSIDTIKEKKNMYYIYTVSVNQEQKQRTRTQRFARKGKYKTC